MKHCINFDFEILTNAAQGYPETEILNDRVVIKRFGPDDRNFSPYKNKAIHRMSFPLRFFADRSRQRNIQKYVCREDFDIFHAHHPSIPHTFVKRARLTGRPIPIKDTIFKTDKPRVLTVHGLLHKMNPDKIFEVYENKIINSYNNIICVDKSIFNYAQSLPGSSDKNIQFIPNSVDTNLFSPTPLELVDKLRIGFAGRLERSRGLSLLEELITNLPDFAELHIIGSASSGLVEDFRRTNSSATIRFHPNVSNDKLPEFFQNIDVLFNPVIAEGISRITLESMACGRPVIMLDKGDRYPVVHGKTGFLTAPNIKDIISPLEHIRDNKDMLPVMAVEARKVVEKEFSNKIIIPKIEEVYEKILDEGTLRSGGRLSDGHLSHGQ